MSSDDEADTIYHGGNYGTNLTGSKFDHKNGQNPAQHVASIVCRLNPYESCLQYRILDFPRLKEDTETVDEASVDGVMNETYCC